jgi:4-diphosphocytidyl-2-C-methyl-D-erythritol kinase/energy-coupling factor transport system substrate-specific component
MLAQHMFNDLEPAAISLCQEISLIKRTLLEDGLDAVMMTGSGSAVFALSDNLRKLEKAAKHQLKGHKVLLTKLKENTPL